MRLACVLGWFIMVGWLDRESISVGEQVRDILLREFPDAEVSVSGEEGSCSLTVKIASSVFRGVSMVSQHRMVYSALNDMIASGVLHAVSIHSSVK